MSLLKSFGFAFRGLKAAVQEQRNLRIHLGAALIMVAWVFGLTCRARIGVSC
jgi:diacylglycerol kinase